jgi:2-C-methyl-D-erythritol 4-phosphate cytidylyltransferase
MNKAPRPEDVSVLIPAGGSGDRLGLGAKAWLPIAGRPLVDWVVDKAGALGCEVLVACPEGQEAPAASVRVAGGATRQESVQRLAQAATRPWSLVWDAASPFASCDLARRVLAAAADTGAATACLAGEVRWYVLHEDQVAQWHPGSHAGSSQTPQAFDTRTLRELALRAVQERWAVQSTVELFLLAGRSVKAVAGEKLNIKITSAEDWLLAAALHHLLSS